MILDDDPENPPTTEDILHAIDLLAINAPQDDEEDLLLLYFSTHGMETDDDICIVVDDLSAISGQQV